MKIGYDLRPLQSGAPPWGVGVYTHSLIHQLAEIDGENEYFLISFKDTPFDVTFSFPDTFKKQSIALPRFDKQLNIFRDRLFLRRELAPFNLDVVHFPNPLHLSLDFDLGPWNRSVVITMHDLIPLHYSPQIFVQRRKPLKYLYSFMLASVRRAGHIIAVSRNTKADLEKLLSIEPGRISVIHQGLKREFLSPPPDSSLVTKKYHLPEHYLFYTGNFFPYKNLENLFQALHILKNNHSLSLALVLGGAVNPFFEKDITALISRWNLADSVILPGYIPDGELPAFYRGAEIFVMPSLYEGFGFPVLEALASGAPVACSSTSSLPEITGDAGLLFDPRSPESIAEAVLKLHNDESLRKEMSLKGIERARSFSWRATAESTLEVYREVCRRSGERS